MVPLLEVPDPTDLLWLHHVAVLELVPNTTSCRCGDTCTSPNCTAPAVQACSLVHQAGAGGKTMHRYGPMLRGLLRLADEVAAMQPWCGTSGSEIQWIPPKSLDLGVPL